MKHSKSLENKTPSDTHWRVQLVCKKAQALAVLKGIADLPLLRTLMAIRQKSREPSFSEVMDSFCKFDNFKNPFATITSLSELCFRIRRVISINYERVKKVISINYGSSTISWKPWKWVRLDLIFSMWYIYINSNQNPLTKFTSSSRSTKFKDVLPWNISQLEFTKQAKVPNKHSVVQFDLIIQIVEIFLNCRH